MVSIAKPNLLRYDTGSPSVYALGAFNTGSGSRLNIPSLVGNAPDDFIGGKSDLGCDVIESMADVSCHSACYVPSLDQLQSKFPFTSSHLTAVSSVLILPSPLFSCAIQLGALGGIPSLVGKAEGAVNLGLYDQAKAFEWVQDYIEAFGGDPKQVTVSRRVATTKGDTGGLIGGEWML